MFMRRFGVALVAIALTCTQFLSTSLSAKVATPVASLAEGVTSEQLCTVVLPPEHLPAGELTVILNRFTVPADTFLSYDEGFVQDSLVVECILAGGETVQLDGPLAVVPVGSDLPEEVPAGTAAYAGPGEVMVYLQNERAQTITFASGTPTTLLSVGVFGSSPAPCQADSSCPGGVTGGRVESLGSIGSTEWARVAGGAVRVSIRRLELAPGATLVLPAERDPLLLYVDGTGTLTVEDAASGESAEYAPQRRVAGTMLPDGETVLRNAGEEPLVLLELSLTAATPAPATPTG